MKSFYVETAGLVNGKAAIVAEKYSGLIGLRAATKFAKQSLLIPSASVARIYKHGGKQIAVRTIWR